MRIAFVLNTFPATTETFIVNQMVSVLEQGHEITIFAFRKSEDQVIHKDILRHDLLEKVTYWKPPPKPKSKRISELYNALFNTNSNTSGRKVLNTINFFKYGKKALSLYYFYYHQWFIGKEDFDVIHCHFAQPGLFVANLRAAGFFQKEKLVTSFHGYDIDPGQIEHYKKEYKVLFKHMDLITYNSEYSKSIIEQITSETEKLRLLPVGLDTRNFQKSKSNTTSEELRVLFCGRLVPFKGPDLAIEIVRKLREQNVNVHLTMIGEGMMKDTVLGLIQKYKLENFVSLKGAVQQQEVIDSLDESHVFLLPGIHDSETGRAENQGLVIQEAQAMELPVLVSDAGGMKYGMIDGETGFVIKEKDVNGFVEKLKFLFENPMQRLEMGHKARAYAETYYDNAILAKKLLDLYSKVEK